MVAQPAEQIEAFVSVDEFLRLIGSPEYAEHSMELVNGVMLEKEGHVMPGPGGKHGYVQGRVNTRLELYGDQHDGVSIIEATTILTKPDNGRGIVRRYDVAYWRLERLPDGIPDRPLESAPDLAVEVVSPSNSAHEIDRRIRELQTHGTPLIWIVYPQNRTALVIAGTTGQFIAEEQALSGGDHLPELAVPLREVLPPAPQADA